MKRIEAPIPPFKRRTKRSPSCRNSLKGSKDDGLCIMPLVIGVTATPQRFDNLIAGTTSTVQKVIVPPEHVRDSGLLKDRIIIHFPDIQLSAEMTMFKGAVENWLKKCSHWKAYCETRKTRKW